jgi:F0F1-type ATP synthase membrane subunit c/vacuolar-type H+-ATPase subunit K
MMRAGTAMLSVLGLFGLGILFVMISPELRATIVTDVNLLQSAMVTHSPFSYIGMGLAVLFGMMFALHRASQPRV